MDNLGFIFIFFWNIAVIIMNDFSLYHYLFQIHVLHLSFAMTSLLFSDDLFFRDNQSLTGVEMNQCIVMRT